MHDNRLRAGRWVRLAPGVSCTSPPVTDGDLLIASLLHGGEESCLSGTVALVVRGFRTVTSWERALVLVPLAQAPRSVGRIQIRPTPHPPVHLVVDGLRLAPVARSVVDHAIGVHHHPDHVRAVVAEAVQRRGCSPHQLQAALSEAPMRGSKRLRSAIADVAGGARSAPEARAARTFREVDLPAWELNHPVRIGARRFVLDFWFEELAAAVEIDGEEFHRFGASWDATLSRDATLQTDGIAVLHVQPSRTKTDDGLLELVVPWLRRRAADRGISWRWSS